MRRRSALGLVAIAPAVAVLSASVLAACQKVSPTVTASVSPCFRVLPEAHAALGGQGKFVDVARIVLRRELTLRRWRHNHLARTSLRLALPPKKSHRAL